MATEVGVGYISIVPEVKGFANAMKAETAGSTAALGGLGAKADETGKKVKDAHTGMGTAAKLAGAVMLTAGISQYLKGAVTDAEAAKKSTDLLNQALKQSGHADAQKAIEGYNSALSNEITIGKSSIREVETKMMGFQNLSASAGQAGGMFERVTKLSFDMAARMGGDAPSAALKLGKALNDPAYAMALGRTAQLTKAQLDHAKQMNDSGDAAGASAYLVGLLEEKYSGAAAASVTSSQKMELAMGKISTQIGTALLPIVEVLSNAFMAVANWMSQNEGLMKVLAPVILAVGAAMLVAAAAVWVMNLALWANPITWIIAAIVLLIVALVALWQNFDTVKDAISKAWDWIKEKTLTAINWIKDGLSAAWDAIKAKVTETWDAITSWLREKLDAVTSFFSEKWDALKQKTSEAWQSIKNAIAAPMNAAHTLIQNVLQKIKDIWDNTFGAMGKVIEKVKGIVNAAASGIASAIQTVIAKIGEMRATLAALPAPVRLLMFGPAGLAMATGGIVPGSGTGDTTPAMLTPGEYVLTRQQVAQVGSGALDDWRAGGQPPGANSGSGITVQNLNVNNPVAEPTSESLPRVMRSLAYVGVG